MKRLKKIYIQLAMMFIPSIAFIIYGWIRLGGTFMLVSTGIAIVIVGTMWFTYDNVSFPDWIYYE